MTKSIRVCIWRENGMALSSSFLQRKKYKKDIIKSKIGYKQKTLYSEKA